MNKLKQIKYTLGFIGITLGFLSTAKFALSNLVNGLIFFIWEIIGILRPAFAVSLPGPQSIIFILLNGLLFFLFGLIIEKTYQSHKRICTLLIIGFILSNLFTGFLIVASGMPS